MSIFLPIRSKFFAWESGIFAEKVLSSWPENWYWPENGHEKKIALYIKFICHVDISHLHYSRFARPFWGGERVKYAYLHTKNSVYIESKYTFEIRIIFGMLFEYFGMDLSVSMRIFPFVCVSMYILSLVCIFYGWYAFLTFGMPFGMRFLPLVCVFYVWYAYFTICSCYLPFEGIFWLWQTIFTFDIHFLRLVWKFYLSCAMNNYIFLKKKE